MQERIFESQADGGCKQVRADACSVQENPLQPGWGPELFP